MTVQTETVFYRSTHDHLDHPDEPNLCRATVVQRHVIDFFLSKFPDATENSETGVVTGTYENKFFTFTPVVEDENALSVNERVVWLTPYPRFTSHLEPNWDAIPEAVRNQKDMMEELAELQDHEVDAETVQHFVGAAEVTNLLVSEDGTVTGYDHASETQFTFTPIKD